MTQPFRQPETSDPAAVNDMIDTRNRVFDNNDVRDVVVWAAHKLNGKSLRALSRQTDWPMTKLQRRIDYVQDQMLAALGAGELNRLRA